MNRNNAYKEEKPCCYFHPKQVIIGVCPLCLNERLLFLAAKQGNSPSKTSLRFQSSLHRNKSSTSIHKIFAFGFLFSSKQCKSQNLDYDVSPTPEESFISIKFEENGVGSWEKSTVSNKVSIENCNWKKNHSSKKTKSVIEHGKSRDIFTWRKRIGHIFHLIRWKKTSGMCHVPNKVEGVKGRKGNWMRTLTKKKTM